MKKRTLFVLIVILVISVLKVKSQNTMYFMDRVPQNLNFNPAFVPKVNFFIGLPGIGFEQVELYNSGFNAGEFMDFLDDVDMENYNPETFINKLGDFNRTFLETRTNIYSFGLKLKHNGYFSFSLSERNFFEMAAPSKVLYLVADYENFEGKMPLNINDISVRMNAFSQMAVTWSDVIMKKLTIGISPKLIGALGGFRMDDGNIRISKDSDGEYSTNVSGTANVRLPVPINRAAIKPNGELDQDMDILPKDWQKDNSTINLFRSAGLFFDLGAVYELNDKWSLSASLLDIGKSKWKNNDYLFTFIDTVIKVINDRPFTLQLPAKLYVAANYRLSPKWNTGFVLRNVFYNSGTNTSATLSLNGYVGRMLSTSVSYTVAHKYDNLGLGLRLRFLPGADLFVVTDNILQAFNYKKVQQVMVSFGVNLAFGIQEKKPEIVEPLPENPE